MKKSKSPDGNFSVNFSRSEDDLQKDKTVSITLQQVEDTSCDKIEFLFYNKHYLVTNLQATAGSYISLGYRETVVADVVSFTGSKTASVSTPGVISVLSMEVVGRIIKVKSTEVQSDQGTGHILFDMESEELRWTGNDDIYAIVKITYISKGERYKYIWPTDYKIKEVLIIAVASDKTKTSLQLSRTDCGEDDEDDADKQKYGDRTNENTLLTLNLKLDSPWSIIKSFALGQTNTVYAIAYIYPVYVTGILEFRASFGLDGTLPVCQFTELSGFPATRKISESLNFSASGIVNLSNFLTPTAALQLGAESVFFDTKGNRILSPTFAGPGSSITVEEVIDVEEPVKNLLTGIIKPTKIRKTVRFSKTLGPTEVACVTTLGLLLEVTGVVRATYDVPQKVGCIKLDVKLTEEAIKNWQCTVHASYLYTDTDYGSMRSVAFMGSLTINNPIGGNPALDAREKQLQDTILL